MRVITPPLSRLTLMRRNGIGRLESPLLASTTSASSMILKPSPMVLRTYRDWARVDQPNHLGPFQARVSIGFLRQHGEGFRENAHRTTCIRTRERRARNVAHPQMIVLMGVCLKGRFDGAQACDPAQLSAHHRHEMIPTFERFVVRIAVMALDDFPKLPSINR